LNNLALVHRARGDYERALELSERGLKLCSSIGDRHREAALHNNVADLLRALGREDEAMQHLKAAVVIFMDVGDPGEMEPEKWKLVEW
jgi:tetratricopeptide (TPR) repeat protein